MKRLMTALALSCVLSTTAFAGDIPSVGITAPAPQPTTMAGEIPTSGLANSALSLIQTLLGLL